MRTNTKTAYEKATLEIIDLSSAENFFTESGINTLSDVGTSAGKLYWCSDDCETPNAGVPRTGPCEHFGTGGCRELDAEEYGAYYNNKKYN